MSNGSDIAQSWQGLVNRLVFLEKRYVFRHGGLELHPSELHVLLAAREDPEANATRLAAKLGVTKGAISQVFKRLEGKRIIMKRSDPTQKNEVTVTFTRLGRAAIEDFLANRVGAQKRFGVYLAGLSESQAETVRRFLKEVEAALPQGA
jgi:DNA-binding MarR family transcriptional regulator